MAAAAVLSTDLVGSTFLSGTPWRRWTR